MFVWAMLQFPLIFVIGWWVIPVMGISGILGRLGGTKGSSKLFRRLGVPLVCCGSIYLDTGNLWAFMAVPFMSWLSPSYGKESFLYKFFKKRLNEKESDLLTRTITYGWYWLFVGLAVFLPNI